MKKSLQTLLALAAFGLSTLVAQAQPAPKILTVDMAKLFDGHYKTEDQIAKLRADEQKYQEELERLNKEGNAMVEKYKDLADQVKNPAATAEAKAKATADAERLGEDIRRKKAEVDQFQGNARNSLMQRKQTFRDLIIEEISKVAVDIAKRKGATLLIDKAGQTATGISNILYSDAAYDITDEVMTEINKDRPAGSAKADASASSADSTQIKLPAIAPKKP